MKKLLLVLIIICLIGSIFMACGNLMPSDSQFQIKISGTSGLKFSGCYGVVTSGGKSVSQSVDGTVPAQYSVMGNIVSVVFQKRTEVGTLRVVILCDGKVIASSSTTASYGVVSVATD